MKRFFLIILSAVVLFSISPAFADEYVTKVAGVTFDNYDGTSRQNYLARFYFANGGSAYGSGSLLEYEYEGSPAIYVLLGDNIIGNIPAVEVPYVLSLITQIDEVCVYVSRFYSDDGELIYYARVILEY